MKGLTCNECGCRDFRTIKTKRLAKGIRRYKECVYCGKTKRTFERDDTPVNELKS